MNPDFLRIIISSVTVYLFIVIAIRLFGKKELAQLSVIDLVFILLISNAVQNAMVGADSTLAGGLVAAASLFVVNYLFKLLLYKFPGFDRLIEGEAVLLVSEGDNEWSLLVFDYNSCSFRSLTKFTSEEYPKLVVMNSDIIVVKTSIELTNAYDLKTGKLVNSSTKESTYWNIIDHYGHPAENIAFWSWMDKDAMQMRWCYFNFDTGKFVQLDEKLTSEEKVFISADGYTAYLYSIGKDIAIFDMRSCKVTGHIDVDEDNLLDMKYAGGNTLAMITRQNDVFFYDMGTGKELASFSGMADYIRTITYNAKNGLAMIMGNTTLEIFDVGNNRRYTGTIKFADRLSEDAVYTAFITDDARYFYLVSLEGDETVTGTWFYCVPHTYRLYTAEELLKLAGEYGYMPAGSSIAPEP
jgi:hypothetical protein